MNKLQALLVGLLTLINVLQAQKLTPSVAKGKKSDFEVVGLIGVGKRNLITGFQFLYSIPMGCAFKGGIGFQFFSDGFKQGDHPGVFANIAKITGRKQNWMFYGQIGKNFFKHTDTVAGINNAIYFTTEDNEKTFQIGAAYRIGLSKKRSFSIGCFILNQSMHTFIEVNDSQGLPLNPFKGRNNYASAGIRIGIIF
jgi:hypothetical protein